MITLPRILLAFWVFWSGAVVLAQNTVGVISLDHEKSYAGYNLVFPHGQGTVWLIDECGEAVNRWDDNLNRVPGNSVYLQPNGDLLVCYNRRGSNNDPINAGGAGQYVELRTWDNEVLWAFEMNDSLQRLHHDVTMLPNGHVLMIAWENISPEDAIANGRDSDLITEGALWPDFILEYDPGLDSIVWEWHAWDHLIQEYDTSKLNYGIIADHPELINLNHIYVSGQADWMHANAIDYHPDLDLIMLSVPHFDEIWFIDHSTSAIESKGHEGGYWGKGGDLVYRWGNPRAYHRGDSSDQKVFFAHDCHWIDDFIDVDYPWFGSVAFFNNRYESNVSAAHIFTPIVDTVNRTFGMVENVWAPLDYNITHLHPLDPALMFSSGLSSFQILPNHNFLTLVGRSGYAFETTPDNEIVWEYIVPIRNGSFIPQGEQAQNNITFRMKRYPLEYSAFDGKDLSSKGYLELNPDTSYCASLISSVPTAQTQRDVFIFPNPAIDQVQVIYPQTGPMPYAVFDAMGRVVSEGVVKGSGDSIPTGEMNGGHYLLYIRGFKPTPLVIIK